MANASGISAAFGAGFAGALRRAALAALLLAGCGPAADRGTPEAEAPLVELVTVSAVAPAGAIRASGLVGYRLEPVLAFTAAGIVADLAVDSGDAVRRGQRLATLRRTGQGANLDEAALARANAERDLARTQALYDQGFVSEARLEDARLAVERARDASHLVAPADGVILRRLAAPAQAVAAGAPIYLFADTGSGLVLRASVGVAQAARITPGDAASVRAAELGGQSLRGRVLRVGAKGDSGTGAFEIELAIEDGSLRSGMVAEAEIVVHAPAPQEAVPMLIVPALALLDARADQGVVFVVGADNIARRRAVRTAGIVQEGVLVVEGLAAGERVISAGAAYARDGEPVRIAAGA